MNDVMNKIVHATSLALSGDVTLDMDVFRAAKATLRAQEKEALRLLDAFDKELIEESETYFETGYADVPESETGWLFLLKANKSDMCEVKLIDVMRDTIIFSVDMDNGMIEEVTVLKGALDPNCPEDVESRVRIMHEIIARCESL